MLPRGLRRGQVHFRSHNSCLSLGASSPGGRRACVLFEVSFRGVYSPTGLPGDTAWLASPPTGWGWLAVLSHGVDGIIHPTDGRPYGRHTTTVDRVKALFDNRPAWGGPRVAPIRVINDRRGRPGGRRGVEQDIVSDVLLETQKDARHLGLTIDLCGGRSVGSRQRRHPASRGREQGKIRKPQPRGGTRTTRGAGRARSRPTVSSPPVDDNVAAKRPDTPGHRWR